MDGYLSIPSFEKYMVRFSEGKSNVRMLNVKLGVGIRMIFIFVFPWAD
jgi:hypothetical protein